MVTLFALFLSNQLALMYQFELYLFMNPNQAYNACMLLANAERSFAALSPSLFCPFKLARVNINPCCLTGTCLLENYCSGRDVPGRQLFFSRHVPARAKLCNRDVPGRQLCSTWDVPVTQQGWKFFVTHVLKTVLTIDFSFSKCLFNIESQRIISFFGFPEI